MPVEVRMSGAALRARAWYARKMKPNESIRKSACFATAPIVGHTSLCRRQFDLHDQSALRRIHRPDRSSMKIHGAFRNRQTQPGALGIAVRNAPERQEDLRQ